MKKYCGMRRAAVKAGRSRESVVTRQAPNLTFSRPHSPPLPSRLDVDGSSSTSHAIPAGVRQHHSAQATSRPR